MFLALSSFCFGNTAFSFLYHYIFLILTHSCLDKDGIEIRSGKIFGIKFHIETSDICMSRLRWVKIHQAFVLFIPFIFCIIFVSCNFAWSVLHQLNPRVVQTASLQDFQMRVSLMTSHHRFRSWLSVGRVTSYYVSQGHHLTTMTNLYTFELWIT